MQSINHTAGMSNIEPGQYTNGPYTVTLFALPAAALAMLFTAEKGNGKKMAFSIVVSAAFVSFLTGITEPIEFTFLFLIP
jgi:PTS system glucose-specific IIC component